jgi:hypothetical protein
MATISYVITISRVAEMLGEDKDKLQALTDNYMEPEDGCLSIIGIGEDEVTAFTKAGIEYLRQLILDTKVSAGRG